MTAPTRDSLLEITWTDPVTARKGYVVIDTLVRGLASGGLRLREGCSLAEVRGLAQGMTRKEALVYDPADRYLPLGGGKGGIDIDPADPQATEVLRRFLAAVLPVVKEQWNTGEDFGLRQETIDKVAADLGLPSTVEAVFATLDDAPAARERLASAFADIVGGISLGDLVGGYGVAQAALVMAEREGIAAAEATAVVQGFGSIGGAAARYLATAGVRVVAVADRDGLIRDDRGLDVEALLAARDGLGVIARDALPDGVELGDRDAWLDVPCDLLVPAAMSYVIGPDDADRVQARILVEGANMPTLPEAEAALVARGIPVVPDFLANVMTNAWWWWVVFGDVAPTSESSFAKIDTVMRRLLTEVGDDADASGRTLRECALELTARNSAALRERFGVTG
ncbi:Glu/Leu/Phe/Val dehydrogenase dimerization domain-containing protein [Nocardioides sp. WV_118_6]|uniref:Glu/Leu/Phe/Val dehydrogenase dimerization domain-containing protein n=1 Tax=Nocardioides simplex TaxID=2045 RepID=UPI00214FF7E2|nr:Glu/Leu/Phe/Val dehydrogenase dimerization domain-containing protein [Pimelobacter simplex]UUW89167.1 glutamate dehydrogenase [Pimelobacter simplex]UUW98671.1 glutamate dehydrogenase [Pimelobacter simplex]